MALMKKEVVYQIETYAQDGKKVEYFRPIYPQNETDIADGFYVALFNMNTPNGMLNCRVEYKAESLDDAFDQFERVANDGANDGAKVEQQIREQRQAIVKAISSQDPEAARKASNELLDFIETTLLDINKRDVQLQRAMRRIKVKQTTKAAS